MQTFEMQQQYVEATQFIDILNEELESCKQEGVEIDPDGRLLFDAVLPSFAAGSINFHGHTYEVGFSTAVSTQHGEVILQTQYKQDTEETEVPVLNIRNIRDFVFELNALINTIKEQAPRLKWLESQKGSTARDIVTEALL